MAKKSIPAILAVMLFAALTQSADAAGKISLKIFGGPKYLGAGDINPGMTSFFDWWRAYAGYSSGTNIGKGSQALHLGLEVGTDVIFELNPHIGIGMGVAYVKSALRSEETIVANVASIADNDISAIPIRLGLFLTLPLEGKFSFTANAGASYYLRTRFTADWTNNAGSMTLYSTSLATNAGRPKNPIGFQAGAGIEYWLSHKLSLYIEAEGHYARFKGFTGTSLFRNDIGSAPAFEESGKLYYESVPALPGTPRLMMVQNSPPTGPEGKPREALMDFSGVSLLAGVKVRF